MIEFTKSGLAKDRVFGWIYLLVLAPVLLVALFAPPNVLSGFPAVDQYTLLMRDMFPMIDRLASVSQFPEVTRLVLSIEWTLVPVQTVLFLIIMSKSIDLTPLRERRAFIGIMLPVIVGTMLWSTAVFWDVTTWDLYDGKSGSLLRLVSTTRVGLAIGSSLVMTLTAFFIAYFLVWIRFIPRVYFDRSTE